MQICRMQEGGEAHHPVRGASRGQHSTEIRWPVCNWQTVPAPGPPLEMQSHLLEVCLSAVNPVSPLPGIVKHDAVQK